MNQTISKLELSNFKPLKVDNVTCNRAELSIQFHMNDNKTMFVITLN